MRIIAFVLFLLGAAVLFIALLVDLGSGLCENDCQAGGGTWTAVFVGAGAALWISAVVAFRRRRR
jgi:hypothetical protein